MRLTRTLGITATGFLFLMNSCSFFAPDPVDRSLLLEFDYYPTFTAYTEGTNAQTGNQVDLVKSFLQGGIKVDPRKENNDLTYPAGSCIPASLLDLEICNIKSPLNPGGWYAHGMVVPWRIIVNGFCKYPAKGEIWFLDNSCDPTFTGYEYGIREDFLVYYNHEDFNNDNGWKRTITAIHELGHVLNLHHCEYEGQHPHLDDEGKFNSKCQMHLNGKKPIAHVTPGPGQYKFCDNLKHIHKHKYDCCSPYQLPDQKPGDIGRKLLVSTEKEEYHPGEIITLKTELKGNAKLAGRAKEILDPAFGHLKFWVKGNDGEFSPLNYPRHLDTDGKDQSPKSRQALSLQGTEIWFETGLDLENSSTLVATFSGYQDQELVIQSSEIPIKIKPKHQWKESNLYHPEAHEKFTSSQAQRFLWFKGGSHLKLGLKALRDIVTSHPETVYAPYANLVLGINYSLPYFEVNEKGEPVLPKDPDFHLASKYLTKAMEKKTLLPDSYVRLLERYKRWVDLGISGKRPDVEDYFTEPF